MRHPPTTLSVLLVALALPAPTAAQMPTATTDVLVIDQGREPRRELRYAWTLDHRERLDSALTLDIAASEDGDPVMDMALPITMAINARVTEVNPDGTAWVALTFADMVFGPLAATGGGLPEDADIAAEFDAVMSDLTPLLGETRVWQRFDARGRLIDANVRMPSEFPPEARRQVTQTTGSVALLPEEPVGVGARWASLGTTVTQGVTLSVITLIELVAIDGDDVTLAISMQLADDVAGDFPTENPFTELSAEGGGSYVLDLGAVYPREADVSLVMRMAGDLPDDTGRVVPVEMDLDIRMTMRSTDVG